MALADHIENLRAKPEHIRERIAVGTAASVTGVIAAVWAVTLAASGTFSLQSGNATVATTDQNENSVSSSVAQTQNNFTQLVGAAGAAVGATSTAPANLHIVDGGTTSSLAQKQATVTNTASATVIPF
jgi:hypothetical protein